jgi:hypothetical protein
MLFMPEVEPISETLHYAPCPWCQKRSDSVIDHLMNQSIDTTWHCGECGESFSLRFDGTGKLWTEKVLDRRRDKILVLMRHGNMGIIFEGSTVAGNPGQQRYYYEAHACPISFMRDIKVIIDLKDGNIDPHGIFRFMGTRPYTDKIEDSNITPEDVAKIIGADAFALPPSSC